MHNFWKKITKPITILAPMDDVTDVVYREIVAQTAKPDVFFTEFTSVDAFFTRGHDKALTRLKYTQNQKPIVAQIWGTDPNKYEKAAKLIEELGFDGIDINMGCPAKKVISKKAGAGLINRQEDVTQIILAVKNGAPNIPLSIKTRLDRSADLTKEWISFLLNQPIEAITLHGRDAKSMSKVDANWDEIGNAVSMRNQINKDIAIIGNGDVKSYEDVRAKHARYNVDGVMIGRGIFSDPWVFDKSTNKIAHSTQDHIDLLINHTQLFEQTWGKTKNFATMKKFFKIYVKGFEGADKIREQLMKTKNFEEVKFVLEQNHVL